MCQMTNQHALVHLVLPQQFLYLIFRWFWSWCGHWSVLKWSATFSSEWYLSTGTGLLFCHKFSWPLLLWQILFWLLFRFTVVCVVIVWILLWTRGGCIIFCSCCCSCLQLEFMFPGLNPEQDSRRILTGSLMDYVFPKSGSCKIL